MNMAISSVDTQANIDAAVILPLAPQRSHQAKRPARALPRGRP
jgi:hypothetical protein